MRGRRLPENSDESYYPIYVRAWLAYIKASDQVDGKHWGGRVHPDIVARARAAGFEALDAELDRHGIGRPLVNRCVAFWREARFEAFERSLSG